MPYNADLRCSYCKVQFNMSWFHEAMKDYNLDFDINYSLKEDLENYDYAIQKFEEYIESKANEYIIYKSFNHKQDSNSKIEYYESIWEWLKYHAEEYAETHPDIVVHEMKD